jgi:hypothetical protein
MRLRQPVFTSGLLLLSLVFSALPSGCGSRSSHSTAVLELTGTSASDFRTMADYLQNAAVETMLTAMARHQGSTPPNVEGRYLATGNVTATSIPGTAAGDAVQTDFCLGPPAGSALEVALVDATVVDAGALSFIEGSGDLFTVYTAFKSVQTGPSGGTCEIHEVVVFSGKRETDGSLSSLAIGTGIVGLIGDCGNLGVNQVQVSQNTASRTGASCVGGGTPQDPTKVLVHVENFLLTSADVLVNGVLADTAPPLFSVSFETSPGFTLSFQSVPPLNESSAAMGEVLSGVFAADTQPAGRSSQYSISNRVGNDTYFAPVISNHTGGPVTARVNVGTPVAFNCGCSLASSPLAQYLVGYHFYDAPGTITPAQTNVLIDTQVPPVDPPEFSASGPFTLGADSGALPLAVP